MITDTVYKCEYCNERFDTYGACRFHEKECAKMEDFVEYTLVVSNVKYGYFRYEKSVPRRMLASDFAVNVDTRSMEGIRFSTWAPADAPEEEAKLKLLMAAKAMLEGTIGKLSEEISGLSAHGVGADAWITPAGRTVEKIKVKRVAKGGMYDKKEN